MEVQGGMRCHSNHDRLCYVKWDGTCSTYTMEMVTKHAKLLVSWHLLLPPSLVTALIIRQAAKALGVVVNKVPPTMTLKLLNYCREKKVEKKSEQNTREDLPPSASCRASDHTQPEVSNGVA